MSNCMCEKQVCTSYLPNEILWGHRFEHESMTYDKDECAYNIRYNSVDQTKVTITHKK